MTKKLIVNCAVCDARTVSEETLQAYESVMVNSAVLFVTQQSKDLLNRFGVTINAAGVHCLPADVAFKIRVANGSAQIKAGEAPAEKTFLTVNGSLEIGEGAQQVMENYVGIIVNGTLTCPESMSAYLGKITVNGSTVCYPDGAIVLKRSAVIDRLFSLRAKNRLYWASKRMIMADPQLDAAVLAAKGATFSAREVFLAESKVEGLIDLIDEQAQIHIVPDGTSVILDDLTLDSLSLKKYGKKLCIIGDLDVPAEAGCLLESLEYLNIQGDVKVSAELKELLLEKADTIEGTVEVKNRDKFLGLTLTDKLNIRVSRELLEREANGVRIEDCVNVTIQEEIPSELIFDRLTIADCVKVNCSAEQAAAVTAICTDVASVNGGQEDGGLLGGLLNGAKELLSTKVINAVEYIL